MFQAISKLELLLDTDNLACVLISAKQFFAGTSLFWVRSNSWEVQLFCFELASPHPISVNLNTDPAVYDCNQNGDPLCHDCHPCFGTSPEQTTTPRSRSPDWSRASSSPSACTPRADTRWKYSNASTSIYRPVGWTDIFLFVFLACVKSTLPSAAVTPPSFIASICCCCLFVCLFVWFVYLFVCLLLFAHFCLLVCLLTFVCLSVCSAISYRSRQVGPSRLTRSCGHAPRWSVHYLPILIYCTWTCFCLNFPWCWYVVLGLTIVITE